MLATLRVGKVVLKTGQRYRLEADECLGDTKRACLPHPEVFKALEPNTDLLLDDGRLRLRVLEHGEGWAETEVIVGGCVIKPQRIERAERDP